MSQYGQQSRDDFTIEDLDDKRGWTSRKCPECGGELYNDVDTENPEHDFCDTCGFNCID